MSKVYITGHRNPDLDSLCAASAYAKLRNTTDPENEYIAVHCSPVSDSGRKQMEAMGLEIPPYKKDVYPKVRDVMLEPAARMQADAPIYDLIQAYSIDRPSVVPIYEGESFKGFLSVDDITGWFLADNKEDFEFFASLLWNAYNTMRTRVPMTDWYYADTSEMVGFRHRTVQGGLFIKLMM